MENFELVSIVKKAIFDYSRVKDMCKDQTVGVVKHILANNDMLFGVCTYFMKRYNIETKNEIKSKLSAIVSFYEYWCKMPYESLNVDDIIHTMETRILILKDILWKLENK